MHNPLVSIVVVCFNHEPYIHDCINSLVNQTYANNEIFVFDNGSTDGSIDKLVKLQREHGFELICQDNIGLPKTLNKAVTLTKGKYFCLVSTDDYWTLDKTQISVNFMENSADLIAACGGNILKIDKNGVIFSKQTFLKSHELGFNDVFVEGSRIPALTAMIRRTALVAVGGYSENLIGEDTQMWLKLTYNGYKIAYLNSLLGFYRHHDTNMSHQKDKLCDEWLKIFSDYKNHPLYEKAISRVFFGEFTNALKINKSNAFRYLKYVRIRHISKTRLLNALRYLFMPYGLVKKRTRII